MNLGILISLTGFGISATINSTWGDSLWTIWTKLPVLSGNVRGW